MGYILPVKPFKSMQYTERANLKTKQGIKPVDPVSEADHSKKLSDQRSSEDRTFQQALKDASLKGRRVDKKI